jgi:hypothetical protein
MISILVIVFMYISYQTGPAAIHPDSCPVDNLLPGCVLPPHVIHIDMHVTSKNVLECTHAHGTHFKNQPPEILDL